MGRWARRLGQHRREVQYGLGSYFLIPDTRRQREGRKEEKRINRNKNEKKNIKIGYRKILKVP